MLLKLVSFRIKTCIVEDTGLRNININVKDYEI